jgi:predicted phage baseplate assembly protein
MSLRPPRLDDRRYDDLREELLRRIPVHAPEWTDHNAADPGIALLELFADMGETLLERFNRVPEAARLAFLQLLGLAPRPARVATAVVKLALPRGSATPITVPWSPFEPRLRVAAGPVAFEASEEISVLPLELQTWIKAPFLPSDREPPAQPILDDLAALLTDHLRPPAPAPAPAPLSLTLADAYEPIPLPPVADGLLPAAISTHGSKDRWLWLALLAPAPLVKAASREADLRSLRLAIADRVLSLGVRLDAALCGPTDHHRCADAGVPPTPWPLEWQISTGRFRGKDAKVTRALYLPLEVVHDGTDAFRRSGSVRLRLPANGAAGEPGLGSWSAASFSPPDPDLLGMGELPPALPNERDGERVLAWIRVRRRDPSHPPLKVRWLDVNIVPVEQAISLEVPELLGYGEGRPGQELRLSHSPVLPGSVAIEVAIPAAASGAPAEVSGAPVWQRWRPIDDLIAAKPDDPVFLLDPESGTIRFGDGLHGRMPLPGEAIRARGYRHGGGAAGNVGAGRITRIERGAPAVLAANLKVSQPLPAEGGADAETVAEAGERLPRLLRHNDRAVGREDFTDLALETPCAGIGRAHCLPRHLPHQRLDGVPGVVTLIVIPAYDPLHPDEPEPDRDQLQRVCAWLEPRRLVTTELYITPPTYVRLSVAVSVEAEADMGEDTLRGQVELALRQLLAPLPPYGPEGQGWPFGRDVGERDLEAAVLRVQGVRLVNGVLISARRVDALGRVASTAAMQRLPLADWQLPSLRQIRVVVTPTGGDPDSIPLELLPFDDDDESADAASPGDGALPAIGIPVPVIREVC